MSNEAFSASMTNRSIRTIRAELEFLLENSVIARPEFVAIMNRLPPETSLDSILSSGAKANNNRSVVSSSYNEKLGSSTYNDPPSYAASSPQAPPPAPAPAAPLPVLSRAVAVYDYVGEAPGDLTLSAKDPISVTEYMNTEWWKGRNERTGEEGIFPRNYIQVTDNTTPVYKAPPGGGYENPMMNVTQDAQPASTDPKKKGTAQKIGGKLGNAAIFGAGATIGSNIVNSIF